MKKILLIISLTLICKYSFPQWIKQFGPDMLYSLNSVYFTDTLNGWAVGDNGVILKYDGKSWDFQHAWTRDWFTSVHFSDQNNGWAVGDNGTIFRYKNNQWINQDSNTNINFLSVFSDGKDNRWILGTNYLDVIFNNKGYVWSDSTWNFGAYLQGMFFTDSVHGWAVGGEYDWNHNFQKRFTIMHYNGKQWAVQDSGTRFYRLWSVYFTDTMHGWAVGDSSTILKYDGHKWIQQQCPLKVDYINSVCFVDSLHGWAVGQIGQGSVILKYSNGVWTQQECPQSDGLYSVYFTDINHGWAVGGYGTILYTSNGGEIVSTNESPQGNNQLSTKIFPNPINDNSNISYFLPKQAFVTIKIYDFTGREILTLENKLQNKGNHNISIPSRAFRTGTYFYILSVEDKIITKRFVKLN